MMITPELNDVVNKLLGNLKIYYSRVKDHLSKRVTSKRYKIGFRECARTIK
jgi:hypothetical protein